MKTESVDLAYEYRNAEFAGFVFLWDILPIIVKYA